MLRFLSAAGVLATTVVIAAGCGSSSLQSVVRHDSKETWNEPNPRILSVESVQLASGASANVVRLQGHFRFEGERGVSRTSYAVLELSDQETGYSGSSAADEATIAAARTVSPRFSIFPDFKFISIRCTIPGGWGGSTDGICSTGWARHGVTFEEHWPLSARSGSRHHSTWTVLVGPSHRVTSIRLSGDKPPQLWKTATQPPVAPLSVARARRELSYLRIFPGFPGTKRCVFGGGGFHPASAFHGTCTTKLLPPNGNRFALAFIEHWGQEARKWSGGWIVTVQHRYGPLVVRLTGSNPPQTWR